MHTGQLIAFTVALAIALVTLSVRRIAAQRGSGRLAQVEFKRRHGAQVAAALGGSVDPRPASPWIDFPLGGRPARMVAAPVAGRLQAGIELLDRELPLQVYLTSGAADELALDEGVSLEQVRPLVARLAALEVDNVASPAPGSSPVLRARFDDVEELAVRLPAIAAVLDELEALRPMPTGN